MSKAQRSQTEFEKAAIEHMVMQERYFACQAREKQLAKAHQEAKYDTERALTDLGRVQGELYKIYKLDKTLKAQEVK
jgi:hypothetical protein